MTFSGEPILDFGRVGSRVVVLFCSWLFPSHVRNPKTQCRQKQVPELLAELSQSCLKSKAMEGMDSHGRGIMRIRKDPRESNSNINA